MTKKTTNAISERIWGKKLSIYQILLIYMGLIL
ncbi:hypothetical protein DR79_864 [Francisella tularensis]|nr:hypothetical protein DR85_370 [Francisella tularensis]KFJ43244.1 hypothetical protein DR79_864 [Francisella tularensis]KFJ62976.1 hypothetical protein DR80_1900 [Francisella tularensis]KFJ70361.1 hypothetical protein DR84_1565 [Francisella tularensis]KFJ77158.1 hypothetical protein DR86_1516 [Francisella tularensis]